MIKGIGATDLPAGAGLATSERDAERETVHTELDRLWARGREILGCDLAIMGGAMTWV